MPTADEVVVEFEARVGKYEADVKRAAATFERFTNAQQAKMQQFERQMRQSSGQISSTLKGLAGAFAAAFSVQQLAGLTDSFTRLQNNLRVAGQEGENLARVQANLLAISQQYGVDVETLSAVFLKASLAQKELGASTEQIIQLNEIVAASLKITGTSAEQARGALLQLGQALGSDIVRGEEFNSLLENALPVVQAAARGIDRFEGSVARLRKAVVDGNVTSREFFEGVLRGGVQTIEDAEKATLTLAGGFEALSSTLTVYFGEADKANGVSAALGGALEALADNLETIIPLLAIVATGLGVGFVKNAVAARVAAAGTTASLASMGIAARAAVTSLLAAFGGPVGLAITAVGAALAYVVVQSRSSAQSIDQLKASTATAAAEADAMEQRLREAGVAMYQVETASDSARSGIDGVSNAAVTAKGKLYELQQQAIRTAVALVDLQLQENSRRRVAVGRATNSPELNQTATGLALRSNGDPRRARGEALAEALDEEFRTLNRKRNAIISGVVNGVDVTGGAPGGPGGGAPVSTKKVKASKARTPKGASGPDAAEIAFRQEQELRRLHQEEIRARIQITDNAEDRADLERELLESERTDRIADVNANKDLSAEQKAAQIAVIERLYGVATSLDEQGAIIVNANRSLYAQAVDRELLAQKEREAQDLADERNRAALDALRLQYDLADTEAERRRLALQILEAEEAYLRSKLEATIASGTVVDAEKERARIALAALEATAGQRREGVERDFEGPLARYGREAKDVDARVEDAAAQRIASLNDTIADTMADALGVEDPFLQDLLNIFLQQNIFGPLAEALSGAGGGSGGLLGAVLGGVFSGLTGGLGGGATGGSTDGGLTGATGSIFARSGGGPVTAGRIYKVGENGEELFRPQQSGVIVPNQRLTAPAPSGGTQVIQVDARGAVMNDQFAAMILRQAKAYSADAGGRAYQQAMKDAPARLQGFQRYGK